MICGSGGSKSRLAKAAGAEPAGQMRDEIKNCTPLWREAHVQVKIYKTHHCRTTFGSCNVEKVHAVVARSTFRSQNVQNTPLSDHFWKLRCRKSARRCGAKHISKSKCTKHTIVGPLLEVQMSKKCTPLWREAHFGSQNVQNTPLSDHFWKFRCRKSARRCGAKHIWNQNVKSTGGSITFGSSDLEKVHAVVARSTFRSENVQNTRGSDHFWRFRCRFAWQAQGIVHLVKSEQNMRVLKHFQLQRPLHHTTLQYITLQLQLQLHLTTFYYTTIHYTTLHSITFNYTTLHYITLHYTPVHYITLHYTTFHYTSLHYTTLHSTTLQLQLHNYTPLHFTTLNYTTLDYITLHYTPLPYTTRDYTTLRYTTFHYTSLHYTTLHSTTLQLQLQLQLHSTTLHYAKLHYTTTLHYITLYSTTLHYTTLHYTEWHCTTDRQVDRYTDR